MLDKTPATLTGSQGHTLAFSERAELQVSWLEILDEFVYQGLKIPAVPGKSRYQKKCVFL